MKVSIIRLVFKRRKKIFFKSILVLFAFYVIYLFVNQQIKIKIKKDELASINRQIIAEKEKKDSILENSSSKQSDENVENSGVRVFENVSQ